MKKLIIVALVTLSMNAHSAVLCQSMRDPNFKAWVGHAACALAMGCPEYIVREAWGYLTSEQQLLANKEAERAIQAWEHAYIKDRGLCDDVGEAMLL